jgi:hypothetical protein
MSWWGRFWVRAWTWVLGVDAPPVHGGNLAFTLPATVEFPLRRQVPPVHRSRPLRCGVAGVAWQVGRCTLRRIPRPATQVHVLCAPSGTVRAQMMSLAIRTQSHKLVPVRATLSASYRVLLCRHSLAVRARVRLLPKRVEAAAAVLRWRCRTQRIPLDRFRRRDRRSSLVWQLPITRHAVPFGCLTTEHRRRCREALQQAARGYVRVQSVYYPVPAHAVARIEIDERLGVLYVHPRQGHSNVAPACLWVVSGVQMADGRPVRAVFKVT